MTVLVMTAQLFCHATLWIGQWQAPATLAAIEWHRPHGCRLTYTDASAPALLSWCASLGPDRCTASVTP